MTTSVYLQNNTPYTFTLSTTVNPPISAGDWSGSSAATVAPAGQNTQMFWTDRDTGITSGVTFVFNSMLAQKSGEAIVDMQTQVQGTTVWSVLAAGFRNEAGSSSSFDSPWYPDQTGNAWTVTWPQDKGYYSLTLNFISSAGGDDAQFTLSYSVGSA